MTREEAIDNNKNLRMYMRLSDKNQPYKFLEENYIALDMAIKALEQEPKWIPVSERLPKRTGEYLVTVIDDSGEDNYYKAVGVAWFAHKKDYDIKESEWRELRIDEKVIAWMPLPTPFESQESEEI